MPAKRNQTQKVSSNRVMTPPMTDGQKELVERYSRKYGHRWLGPGLLLAAMREIRREFDLPEEEIAEKVAA